MVTNTIALQDLELQLRHDLNEAIWHLLDAQQRIEKLRPEARSSLIHQGHVYVKDAIQSLTFLRDEIRERGLEDTLSPT